jgi:Ca2+:H+ antiporter
MREEYLRRGPPTNSLTHEAMNVDQTRRLRGVTKKRRAPLRNDERVWVRWPATLGQLCASEVYAMKRTLSSHRVNALLVFVPLGIIGAALQWNPTTVFVLNFLAILPFATLLNFATDELCLHTGIFGHVLDAVFGRPVDLIVGFLAMTADYTTNGSR